MVSLATGCRAEKRAPFRPVALRDRLSPMVLWESCTDFVDRCLPVRRYAEKCITVSFCTAGQNAANQHFQYTIIIRKRQVNNVN